MSTPYCARCGSSMEWVQCGECEDGFSHHDCGEDCCPCADPEPNVQCDHCSGKAGWWSCLSSLQFCQTNPLPGAESEKVRYAVRWVEEPA